MYSMCETMWNNYQRSHDTNGVNKIYMKLWFCCAQAIFFYIMHTIVPICALTHRSYTQITHAMHVCYTLSTHLNASARYLKSEGTKPEALYFTRIAKTMRVSLPHNWKTVHTRLFGTRNRFAFAFTWSMNWESEAFSE